MRTATKLHVNAVVIGLLMSAALALPSAAPQHASASAGDKLIAIDVLLQPDQTMVDKANQINARLRGNYPEGYLLDATHAPHVTMLQRFVRVDDFDAVTAAITKVLAAERPGDLQLKATGLQYAIWNGVAVTAIVVERTPALTRLQQKVADAVAPFSASGGTEAAFIDTPKGADIVPYVESFVPKSTGANYFPHVTAGVATEAFVKQLKAEPFETVTFRPNGVAIYQLGNFGTASKKLWQAPVFTTPIARAADPLPSWNDGKAKQAIITFVEKVTTPSSPDFVPVSERIATFDNDGTLWAEQPMPVQLFFVVDRIKALAAQHPEWNDKEPFASVLKGNMKAAMAGGDRALMDMVMATHTGMTTEEFEQTVKDWMATATNPKTGKRFVDMTYQPMLDVLAYLRANGFKTFIVSGGGIEFIRAFAEHAYGIPPEQIVGSSVKTKFELRAGTPLLVRLPDMNFNDDNGGKPVGINEHIGRRPIAAFGNSDGDLQMLQWTAAGPGARFCLYVHHDDDAREFAYDRQSQVGRLDKGLDEANAKGWTVVSMKDDWKAVYPSAR